MKFKKLIIRILLLIISIFLVIGSANSFAANGVKNFKLSTKRYVWEDGEYKEKGEYLLNTTLPRHKIYQILSVENQNNIVFDGTGYYCLNAVAGAWSGDVSTDTAREYNKSYNLDTDLEKLASENSSNEVYSGLANNPNIKEIIWLLDNIYIPKKATTDAEKEENLKNKQELLARAGIVYKEIILETGSGEQERFNVYKYEKQGDYDYTAYAQRGKTGYFEFTDDNKQIDVVLTDELVESVQQSVLWYFTNYYNNTAGTSGEKFDIYKDVYNEASSTKQTFWLNNQDGNLANYKENGVEVGWWYQEQASILAHYLRDAAIDNAKKENDNTKDVLNINKTSAISKKSISSEDYYVVGPIKIEKQRDVSYELNKVLINDKEDSQAKITDSEGKDEQSQNIMDYIGKEFYIKVPVKNISESNVRISFEGKYLTNEKTLWISTTSTEQPIVEVKPTEKPIEISTTATIEREFDLALRKFITEITSKDGVNTKTVRQEPKIDTSKLADGSATTATYTLDKTPVAVKQGDFIKYTLRVYNEGGIDGYVNKITDNIPTGLQFVYQKDTDGKTLIACDSQGDSEEIEVDSSVYEKVSSNGYWSIDKADETTIKKDTYNGESTVSITCDVKKYLGGTNKLLNAYDESKDKEANYDGSGLTYVDVAVYLRVKSTQKVGTIIRNEAAITEAQDTNNVIQDNDKLKDRDSQTDKWPGKDGDKEYQDDEDYDNIVLEKVDLALTKFIAAISTDVEITDGDYLTADKKVGSKDNPYTRQTSVDTTALKAGTATTATYNQVKDPLLVEKNSYVLYDIRVYNEGDVDVYAGEVKDYLPNYLDYVSCEFNDNFGWKVAADGKTISTNYLSSVNGEKNKLKAFDKINDDGKGSHLDYRDLQILCKVNSKAPNEQKLVNSAEITKYEDENGKEFDKDVDSESNNIKDKNKEERYEDDDDYEVVKVKPEIIDLALTKFITAVSEDTEIVDGEYLTGNKKIGSKENPYLRATKVDTTKLRDDPSVHDATYTLVKDPLTVPAKSYVLYNIRVYNEGSVDCYAGEVKDHLPEYLDYVECEFNNNYKWEVAADGKTISTKLLSAENGEKNKLTAFNKNGKDDGAGSELDYRDLQVLCRVNDNAPTNTNIVNVAEITKYEDENGEDVPKDVDSTPDNVNEKNEDDDDYEVILIKTFDLSLLKYVSTVYVTEDGVTTTTETGNTGDDKTDIIPKVEIHRKKVDSTIVKFGYTIKITNEGDIAGYAKEITDYVPEGLKFYEEDNKGWVDEGNNVISTTLLENTLLQPGESAQVTVIFRWINSGDNLGLKTNIAEISKDYNEEGIPDRDSTPDNQKEGEDDIDDASVLLAISTGLADNIIKYTTIGAVILIVLATGIIVIKKYVL